MASAANGRLIQHVTRFILSSSSECKAVVTDIFQRLKHQLKDFGIKDAATLKVFLQNYPEIFCVRGYVDSDFVMVTTDLSLCLEHSKTAGSCHGGSCQGLHFCKFYLLSGSCRHQERCLFGHDLSTPHNLQLLRDHFLDNLTTTDLRMVFTLPTNRHGVLRPQVCRYYNIQSGCHKRGNCHSLHICRPYVDGSCKFGKKCKRNHNITNDTQVDNVLTMYGVSLRRTPKEILQELQIYMTDDGDEGEYTDNDDSDVDVDNISEGGWAATPAFAQQGRPPKRFGSMPNLLRKQPLSLHNHQGVPRQRYPSVSRVRERTISDNYGSGAGRRPARSVEELCLFHLKGVCRFGEKCNFVHSIEKYQWRFTAWRDDGENAKWRSLAADGNVELERQYCQPEALECLVQDIDGTHMKVNFKTFTAVNTTDGVEYKIKRLDVLVKKIGPQVREDYFTKWLWYWRDKARLWHLFGSLGDTSMIHSEEIEWHYQESRDQPSIVFNRYVLNLTKMRLQDRHTNHHFKVQRRPHFTHRYPLPDADSSTDGYMQKAVRQRNEQVDHLARQPEYCLDNKPVASRSPLWSATELSKSSKEYQEVKSKFAQTLGRAAKVINIYILKNKDFLENYERQKILMAPRSKRKPAAERELYYCPLSDAEDINFVLQNGVSGQPDPHLQREAFLGKGAYFYVNAGKADKPNYDDATVHCLFVANCLVGKQVEGPPTENSGQQSAKSSFDSVVDDMNNPKVFVIFNMAQVYVKYAITFKYE